MGQRHQYLILYPEMYLNDGNPNNRGPVANIIHHQWLYGKSAIITLERVLKFITNNITDNMDYNFGTNPNGYQQGEGTYALATTISVDPESGYFYRAHIYKSDTGKLENYQYNEITPDLFDNNDGITIIGFEKGIKKPFYAFVTPNHLEGEFYKDEDGQGPWNAYEYLSFYYPEQEVKVFDKKFAYIFKNSILYSKERLKALLPNFFDK